MNESIARPPAGFPDLPGPGRLALLCWAGSWPGRRSPPKSNPACIPAAKRTTSRAARRATSPSSLIALFFAILHLGVLMLGTGGLTWMSGIYLVGLILALVALILG